MSSMKSRAVCTLASLAMVGVGACSNTSDVASRLAAPSNASGIVALVVVPEQTAQVCKAGSSPSGTYTFTTVASGSANTGDVVTSPVSITVVQGGPTVCKTIFSRTQAVGLNTSDPAAVVTVTEAAAPGTILGDITGASDAAPFVKDVAGRNASVGVNAFHSATATFFNVAVSLGCSYTQGYWKNHTDKWAALGYSPTAKFDGGMSWIDLFNTPPKGGDVYIQLAHQYMAATLNLANGASMPADVKVAYDKATAYFAAGGDGKGSGDITGVAAILDAYNNGLSAGGPPHCE